MTELSVGALFGTVELTTVSFDRGYARVVTKMADLGARAGATATETTRLDETLTAVSVSASRASTALGRGAKSAAEIAAADQKAAASAERHAAAEDQLAVVMGDVAGMTTREQRAVLSLLAAHENLSRVEGSQTATLTSLARAQAAVIGADERLTTAQNAAAASAERQAGALRASGVASRTAAVESRGAAAGMVKTAGELGLLVGGFELVKKALDFSHEATQFQADMVKIDTQAGASRAEVSQLSAAVLKLAPSVAQSPEALATSLYHVYSATKTLGYSLPQMLEATKVAGEGATASGADLEATTNALTATMVSGLGSVNNMAAAMGALNAIVGAGDMKLSDLNEALGTGILAALKVFGVSLEQGGAALAVFGDNNIRGAEAATKLRMVVQDLSKPAAHADDVLNKLGLSSARLRDDLEKGGLSLALHDLKTHLEEAGVTGSKVGPLIEDAFTKKAGVGLAVLLNNLDQYDQKQAQITRGAGKFGSAWTTTTQTARFALSKLWTEIEVGGMTIASKLTPEVADAATWLGTSLPHAITVLAHILGPTIHLVGVGLVGAWHAADAVIGPVASGLVAVGHVLAEHAGLVSHVIGPLLAMWVAWKGYQIALVASRAIQTSFALMANSAGNNVSALRAWGTGVRATFAGNATEAQLTSRIMQVEFAKIEAATVQDAATTARAAAVKAEAFATMTRASEASSQAQILAAERASQAAAAQALAAEEAAATAVTAAETAAGGVTEAGAVAAAGWRAMLGPLALIGIGVGALTMAFGHNSDAAREDAAEVSALTDTIKQDSGAVGENTRAYVANALQKQHVLDAARALGISLSDVTSAALGNTAAQNRVNAAYDIFHARLVATSKAYQESNNPTEAATRAAKAQNEALGKLWPSWDKVRAAINGQNADVKDAVQAYKNVTAATAKNAQVQQISATAMEHAADVARKAAAADAAATAKKRALALATSYVVDTSGNFVQSTEDAAKAADDATKALDAQTIASNALKTAEDRLSGVNQTAEAASDALSIAVGNLANKTSLATDANGKASTSLKQNTVAGATNRQMLLGIIQAAQAQAQATADQKSKTESYGKALLDGNRALKTNEDHIRAAAAAAGFDKGETDKLISSLGILSKLSPNPTVDVNTARAQAKAAAIQAQINDFRQKNVPTLDADPTDALHHIADIQNGLASLHDKTINVDVFQRVLGAPIPRATGGAVGPVHANFSGMVHGPGTGTSDTAGLYKFSDEEFVSNAMSAARNAGALEAGNRGATLVAIDGLTRKLQASSARASVPVSRPVALSAPSGAGMDWGPVVRKLDSIERRLESIEQSVPDRFAVAAVGGLREAGGALARQMQRDARGR